MRFYGLALLAGAAVLGACGGGENKRTDTKAAALRAPAAAPPRPLRRLARLPRLRPRRDAQVKMIGDDKGYRFEPANITIKQATRSSSSWYRSARTTSRSTRHDSGRSKAQLDANMDRRSPSSRAPCS